MLSHKQQQAFYYLEKDPIVDEVFYGGGAGCFTGETLIKTINGDIPISEIKIGDCVLSYNLNLGISEFKQVVNKFAYGGDHQKRKVIIFDYCNQLIKCTYEHEFYYEGNWQPAYRLAQRAVEMGSQYKQQICDKQFRSINDNRIQGLKAAHYNETCVRREGLLSNNDKAIKQVFNHKDSQVSCSGVFAKLRKQANGKSQKWNKNRQLIAELRVGYYAGECIARLSKWVDKETNLHQLCKRGADWNIKTNRATSKGDKTKVYTESVHKGYACEGVQHKSIDSEGYCNKKKLEARTIELSKIKSVCVYEFEGFVYDLTVKNNHNYVLSAGSTIVHNSGKTFLGCFWQIVRRIYNPGTRGFMGRNTYMEFKTFTFKTFWEVWNEKFAGNPMRIDVHYNSQDKTVYFTNGSEILIKDLSFNSSDPEFNALGGMELTDAFIDEVPGIQKKAKDVVSSRIRHKLINGKAPLLMTGNPTNNWVKSEFVSDKFNTPIQLPPHQIFIPALLYENPNQEFVARYKRKLETLPLYDRMRLLDGDWSASEEIANPFMHAWNPDVHVSMEAQFNSNLPVFLSVDFNINPLCMIAAHVWREGSIIKVHVFKEFEIKKGSVPELIDVIRAHFPTPSLIRLTGDAGGVRGDIRFRDNVSIFNEIMKGCRLAITQLTVKGNPQHNNSRADCNKALAAPNYQVRVNPICAGLIRDMSIVACDADGLLIKINRRKIAEQADFLDTFRYLIHNFVPL